MTFDGILTIEWLNYIKSHVAKSPSVTHAKVLNHQFSVQPHN